MRSMQQFWAMRRMGVDRVAFVRLGPLNVWLARADKEWGYAVENHGLTNVVDISHVPSDVVPKDLKWATAVFDHAPQDYALRPAVPDRPLVVRPINPVRIPHGQSGTFFALLPVFVEIYLQDSSGDYPMGTVPSQALSDTWFGTPTGGDLCYSLPFAAQRDLQAADLFPHQIICPVSVENRSRDDLAFEKFCLRPRHLGIFADSRSLWSSAVRIQHEGAFQSSAVVYEATPPRQAEGWVQLAKPQETTERVLSRLTFSAGFTGDFIASR